jgi:HEAT repeat protein
MDADPEFNETGDSGEIKQDTMQRLHHFLAMLEEEDPSRRWKAAESLGRMGDVQATEPLIILLTDEDWRVRQKAAWALGEIGDPRALLPLRRAMMHETEGVKEIISESLEKIKRKIRQ